MLHSRYDPTLSAGESAPYLENRLHGVFDQRLHVIIRGLGPLKQRALSTTQMKLLVL